MNEIGIVEAQNHFSDILRRVEEGESFVITRDDKAIATLSPSKEEKKNQKDAWGKWIELVNEPPIGTLEEITEWKAEGRR